MKKRTARLCPAMILLCFLFTPGAHAQGLKNYRVTLSVSGQKLATVFKLIEGQAPFSFVYNATLIAAQPPVTLAVKDRPLDSVLQTLVAPFNGSFELNGSNILVTSLKQTKPVLAGTVLSRNGPVANAAISLQRAGQMTTTDERGRFSLPLPLTADTLEINHVSYQRIAITVTPNTTALAAITLEENATALEQVTVNTGYQSLPKERATGSFEKIDSALFNRTIATNVLDHLENTVPGMLFNRGDAGNTDPLLIRGRSSIYAEVSPLIVVDNFPYDGDINNLNPNDIESVTLLKDAAAASIWGARAGNGVIVITTKKGRSGKTKLEFNSSITFIPKPDLYSPRALGSADYIGFEKELYTQGYYAGTLSDPFHTPVTPAVELLNSRDNEAIQNLEKYDVRRDLTRYFYKTAANNQNVLNISGGNSSDAYFISAGWDRNTNAGNLTGAEYNRVTLHAQNAITITKNLQADASVNFVQSNNESGNNPGYSITGLYPYAQLGAGKPLDNTYRAGFTDTAVKSGMPGWKYYPLDDISHTQNSSKTADYLVNAGIKYKMTPWLDAEARYQYEYAINTVNARYDAESFYTRNLVNSYYQPVGSNHFPVPKGDIIDNSTTTKTAHQGRVQLNYHQTFHAKHQLTAIAGWEIKDVQTNTDRYRLYGYQQQGSLVSTQLDFNSYFQSFSNPYASNRIPNPQYVARLTDRFISYYANAAYVYDNRYTVSASARNDAANLFGVSTNQKGVPLWSAGAAWTASNEKWYHAGAFPYLKLRATYGYNGNFSRLASALTTVKFSTSSTTTAPAATIQNPPNADLRWEVVKMLNIGLDFATKNKVLSGSIEYYRKTATDLIAPAPLDPTLGFANNVYQNTASMKGHGVDIQLDSRNIEKGFKWATSFIFSYSTSAVTKFLLPVSANGSTYLNNQIIKPVIGKPVYAIFSYRWAGLDPQTGAPMGYIGKTPSSDISTILNHTSLDSLVYNGPAQPTYFGALRNTFSWRNLTLSFIISYKLGYYFRKPSVNYSNLSAAWYWSGSADYTKRWQKPGDELHTDVPALVYPINGRSDNFYTASEVLVEKADNIRLEDIRLDYRFRHFSLYIYAANLGVLWVANKDGIDPYYNNAPAAGKTIAFGLKANF